MSEQVQEDAVRFNWYLLILNWLSDEMDKFINHLCVGISLNVHLINLYDFGTFGCEVKCKIENKLQKVLFFLT